MDKKEETDLQKELQNLIEKYGGNWQKLTNSQSSVSVMEHVLFGNKPVICLHIMFDPQPPILSLLISPPDGSAISAQMLELMNEEDRVKYGDKITCSVSKKL
jgi:hypothetical protein